MKKAVRHITTGAIRRYGTCEFTDFDPVNEEVVSLNEDAAPDSLATPLYYYKVVAGNIVEMSAGEKADVDAANIPPVSAGLTDFVDANAIVTDPYTGLYGPFHLMQTMQMRKDLYNDNESPLYETGFTPILGASGMLQDHADRIENVELIHSKIGWHEAEVQQALYYRPRDLLVYYGWPSAFNTLGSNEAVAKEMARYGLIVLGAGLQDPTHGDYANSSAIITRIKQLNPKALIFGYVATTEVIGTFQTKVGQWNTLGVHGIFMDMAGYDYGTNRADFNTRVDYVHGRSSANVCFVNAWNADHVLGTANDASYPNTTWNPGLVASSLTTTDWYMLESFPINTTAYSANAGYEAKADWAARGVKAVGLRTIYGVNMAALGMIDNASATGQALFNFLFISALQFSLDGVGSSDTSYASGSAAVYWWARPSVVELGILYDLNPSVQVDAADSDVYWRYVERAKLMLDFSTGAQLSEISYENGLGVGLYYKRHKGTSPYESWITAPTTGTALTTGAIVANRLYAIPVPFAEVSRLDRLAINVTTLGTGNARLGIYEDSNAYPGKRLLDAGEVSIASTGVKALTISHLLAPGRKWLVLVSNGTPTLRAFAVASLINLLGYDNTLGTAGIFGFYVSFTYAALPAAFPGSPNLITAVPIPAVFARLV
jgi:hypothetical protein